MIQIQQEVWASHNDTRLPVGYPDFAVCRRWQTSRGPLSGQLFKFVCHCQLEGRQRLARLR